MTQVDIERARFNMIEQQVRPWDVLDPRVLGVMSTTPTDSVLEIGTGSGYLTACLSRLGNHVTSIEIFPDFRDAAATRLAAQGYRNVTLREGDAADGIGSDTRYDVIAVTGSLPLLQRQFHDNLAIGGRLFVISGTPPVMEALLVTRVDEHNWSRESLFETSLPPLLHATQPRRFVL